MSMELIVDRIETNIVIVERDGKLLELPIELFSPVPNEGDSIHLSIEVTPSTDALQTAAARLERLKQRDCGEDEIDL